MFIGYMSKKNSLALLSIPVLIITDLINLKMKTFYVKRLHWTWNKIYTKKFAE